MNRSSRCSFRLVAACAAQDGLKRMSALAKRAGIGAD